MRHLTPDQLVDFAEGQGDERTSAHVAACAGCRRRIDDLRATMSTVADVDGWEPSPLFWDQFSARVRDRVALAPPPSRFAGWTLAYIDVARTGIAAIARSPYAITAIACAMLLLVVGLATSTHHGAVAVPTPLREVPISTEANDVVLVPPEDATLDLVADLGASLDWQQVHDAALVAHTGLVDRAISGLSPAERAELGKLLRQELREGGN